MSECNRCNDGDAKIVDGCCKNCGTYQLTLDEAFEYLRKQTSSDNLACGALDMISLALADAQQDND